MSQKKQILLVEDDVLVLKTVKNLLEARGYDVSAVHGGEEALKVLKEKCFDLVLSDIRMPRVDGIRVIEGLREGEKQGDQRTPVILITGYASEEAPIDAFRLGVVDYVLKPFNNDQLLACVKRALDAPFAMGDLEITVLVKQLHHLVEKYQIQNKHEIFKDQDLKKFFESLTNIIFSMEKAALNTATK